jgi:hypothetical protein
MMKILQLFCGLIISFQLLAADFHDPMRPPVYALNKFRLEKIKNSPVNKNLVAKVPKKDPWILNSILYSSNRQHAIINNKLVRKGEVIGGAKLVSLKPDSVRLISRGKVVVLKLPSASQSIKKSLQENKL